MHTHEGAQAFVKFYWKTVGDLDQHPQIGVISRFAEPGCETCMAQEQANANLVQKRARYEVASNVMSNIRVRGDSTRDQVVVQFHEKTTGRFRVEGNSRTRASDVDQVSAMRADWINHEWMIGEIGAR